MASNLFSFDHAEVLLRLDDGVIVCDAQRTVHFVNPQAAHYLGGDADALLGQPIGAIFAAHKITLPPSGSRIVHNCALAISARPLPGCVAGYPREGTLYLISDRPGDLIRQRDFVGALAHELRSPLTVIRGYSELLLRRIGGPLQPDQEEFLSTIAARAIDLTGLVNNLIVLANVESGHLRDEPIWVDLREQLDNALDFLIANRRLPRHLPRYTIAPQAARLLIDPDVLRHILEALLSHALVVTPPQGVIIVQATRVGQGLELEISDSGAPVPAYQRRRLFEHWGYVPRSPAGVGRGTGLELALARTFVERCGGRISYEPGDEWGNRWLVQLPLP